jgi:hypothetical protein
MTVAEAISVQGDYTLRGPDFETLLVGPVTATVIDADRFVRLDWRNGFPNWALYRAAIAGDDIHTPALRQWVVAFTVAYCADGGIKRHAYSDELACVAAWDALHMLIHNRQMQPYTATAETLGVSAKTYRRLRDMIYARLRASLDEYWVRLLVAVRQVWNYERKSISRDRAVKSEADADADMLG